MSVAENVSTQGASSESGGVTDLMWSQQQPPDPFTAAQPSFTCFDAMALRQYGHCPSGMAPCLHYDPCCQGTNPWHPDYSLGRYPPYVGSHTEIFSRKVFVGGLPFDSDEDEINATFSRFGPLQVDWPHKSEKKSHVPPKGFVFLIFEHEMSVQMLISNCLVEDNNYYMMVSTPSTREKAVQIRPWKLSDVDYSPNPSQPLDSRKVIFVGGVPRQMTAYDLANSMQALYGQVCYAGIDLDPELKYPKGAGRVAFCSLNSFVAAVSARFVNINTGKLEKRVEIKPYMVQDQGCDECQASKHQNEVCDGRLDVLFCEHLSCLQYYCQNCWTNMHSCPQREGHTPVKKEPSNGPHSPTKQQRPLTDWPTN